MLRMPNAHLLKFCSTILISLSLLLDLTIAKPNNLNSLPSLKSLSSQIQPTPPPPPTTTTSSTTNQNLIMFCGGFFNLFQDNDYDLDTSNLLNSAIVFIKPHANTKAVQTLVTQKLTDAAPSMTILSEQTISGSTIDKDKLIDQHYYAIASKATILSAKEISPSVPSGKFQDFFGQAWDQVLKDGKAANAMEACRIFDCTEMELSTLWREAEADSKVVKFGGGFYCGKLQKGDTQLYVFNAFFMNMRAGFVDPDCSIYCYEVQWDPQELSWSDFRGKVLGPTDPSQAPKGSIRRTILNDYQRLGLDAEPNKGLNGVHASASPFEGLSEKTNWLGKKIKDDPFGAALLKAGLKKKVILDWCKDPRLKLEADSKVKLGSVGSVFDELEDNDVAECFQKLTELKELN